MENVVCPHCGSEHLTKDGNKNGMQRYKCKACNKKFSFGKYEPHKKKDTKEQEISDKKIRKKNLYNELFNLGHEWEELVQDILADSGKKVESQKRLDNDKIVDFMFDKTIVECKLSAGTEELLETIRKYSEYCDKLEIWSLNKCSQEKISTYISKDSIIDILERKVGRWHEYIEEFKEKNINVEMLYYEDIIKKIKNPNIKQKFEELYIKYTSIQPNGGNVVWFEENLKVDYESFLLDTITTKDNEKIYINNSVRKKLQYSIKDKYISPINKDNASYKQNWQVNGLIRILDLKKFKIPNNFYREKANKFYKDCSFLELTFEYINKNEFMNYETIFDEFYLIDENNNKYNSILGYEIDNQLIPNRKSSFIQRHIDDISYDKKKLVKLYFKIQDSLTPKDFILEVCDSNENIVDIELINENKLKNNDSNNIVNIEVAKDFINDNTVIKNVEKTSYEKFINNDNLKNIKEDTISKKSKNKKNIFLVLTLIILSILILLLILLLIINKEKLIEIYYKNEKYKLGLENRKNCNYETAIEIFTELDNFRKSDNQIKECYFSLGDEAYKLGEFENAITYYEKSFENDAVSEIINKCNNIKSILGTYQYENLIITLSNNWIAYKVSDYIENYGEKYYFEYDYENDKIIIDESFYTRDKETKKQRKTYHYIEYELKNGSLYLGERCYNKINNDIKKPYTLYLPEIGMTFEEVENSTFGLPDRVINKGGYGSGAVKIKYYNPDKYPESWRYEFDDSTVVISFKNGKVTDIVHYDSKGFPQY